jgi:predicted aspartyl protease
MKSVLKIIFTIILTTGVYTLSQAQERKVKSNEIYGFINEKNFFKAKEIYLSNQHDFSKEQQYFIESVIDNAFNRLEESTRKIEALMEDQFVLPDSLMVQLLKVYEGNAMKLFEYKKAKQVTENILSNYKELLSETEEIDLKNNLKIWTALENTPKQKISKKSFLQLRLTKDKAGLDNLKVSTETTSESFIFDTGANISTITESTAQNMGMTLIPAEIEVGTITGKKVKSQLAVCDIIKLGDIEINNVIFLVFEDKDLYIESIDYQINGILGFPIINALEEIQITQDGFFIVPDKQTVNNYGPNMALDGLTPLIFVNGMHFSFDSGASTTILYRPYYLTYKNEIAENHQLSKITFGGAGGDKEFDGYSIDVTFDILDKEVNLKNVLLIIENIKEKDYLNGNIGQDVIGQFNKMTLSFNQMFIRFD